MRMTALRRFFLFAALGVIGAAPVAAFAQADGPSAGARYKAVKGWVINQYERSESGGDTPSCSAVFFKSRSDAVRIERFRDGYLFGFNGLSRKQQGALYPMAFWFDGDRATAEVGEGGFIADGAYPDDDWLSFFHPAAQKPGPMEAIAGRSSITFAFPMPGNRTGNDEVTTIFQLKGSAAAMLALDECYEVASTGGLPAHASLSCPDDGPRLPGSGVCRGRASNYLNIVGGEAPMLMDGCQWLVNETPMPGGDYLFYLAASCGRHVSQLEFSAGAKFAEVSIARSALMNGAPGGKIITVGSADAADPGRNLLQYARTAMGNWFEAAGCRVRSASIEGWPSDALVVDVGAAVAAKATAGEPRHACGPFGLDEENTAYWRVFGGNSWFFDLGQDAYQDIDPRSLTVVPASELPKP